MKAFLAEFDEECMSQLFGEAEFPDEWLEKDVFSPCEFFLCKIDLADFGGKLLPDNGYLYIFIDMPSSAPKAKVILRFYADEPDACTDFNDGFFGSYCEEASIVKDDRNALGEVIINEEKGDDLIIFSVSGDYLPYDLNFDRLSIVIDKQSLSAGDYSRARLVF